MIVAFTVNNRPQYLRETLDSWSKVRGIGTHTLLFRCEPGCDEAVALCQSVDFAPALVAVNPHRYGVLGNPWAAIEHAFAIQAATVGENPSDVVCLAEEDLTVSPDWLEFVAACQRYRDDPQVLGVTSYQHHARPGGLAGLGLADWSGDNYWHFWVWGTWRDRWESLIRDDWDFTYRENGGGPGQRGWDWRLRNLLIVGRGMKMIAPSMARSQHIGKFGGAHCTPAQFEGLLSPSFAGLDVPPQRYQEVGA